MPYSPSTWKTQKKRLHVTPQLLQNSRIINGGKHYMEIVKGNVTRFARVWQPHVSAILMPLQTRSKYGGVVHLFCSFIPWNFDMFYRLVHWKIYDTLRQLQKYVFVIDLHLPNTFIVLYKCAYICHMPILVHATLSYIIK